MNEMDERIGKWTNIQFAESHLLIMLKGSSQHKHIFGPISLGLAFFIFVAAGSEMSPLQVCFFLLCIASMTWRLRSQADISRDDFPLVIFKDQACEHSGVRAISASSIKEFIARENTNRDPVEDTMLMQVWMVLYNGKREVVYQERFFRKERSLTVSEQLNDWLGG